MFRRMSGPGSWVFPTHSLLMAPMPNEGALGRERRERVGIKRGRRQSSESDTGFRIFYFMLCIGSTYGSRHAWRQRRIACGESRERYP